MRNFFTDKIIVTSQTSWFWAKTTFSRRFAINLKNVGPTFFKISEFQKWKFLKTHRFVDALGLVWRGESEGFSKQQEVISKDKCNVNTNVAPKYNLIKPRLHEWLSARAEILSRRQRAMKITRVTTLELATRHVKNSQE